MADPLFLSNPYEYLHIYYLEGIPDDPPDLGEHFIGNWEEEGFSFLFFTEPGDEEVKALVASSRNLTLLDTFEMSCEEWHGEKIEAYTTGSLCVAPPWKIPFVPEPGVRTILLDPGVVFGTGRHRTTEDCLGFIEMLTAREKIDTVLDVGTGTGLLALGAAALGASRVLALDFNRLAVGTALNNIRLNRLEDRILAFQARGEDFAGLPFDLMVANIHYDVMKDLIEVPGALEKRWFLLSGLLKTEARKILDRLAEKPVSIEAHISPDGIWNTILGRGSEA